MSYKGIVSLFYELTEGSIIRQTLPSPDYGQGRKAQEGTGIADHSKQTFYYAVCDNSEGWLLRMEMDKGAEPQ